MEKEKYDHRSIEKKWQDYWEKEKLFQARDFDKKEKEYILIEFPYPSGDGLHVGHCRSYTALDILSRKRRMQGKNVLYPIGWDAFGLPTENYALETGIHPKDATKQNTDKFRKQLKSLGYSFDWSREINTTDPKYYKWTQWIFLQLYKKGLAYREKMPINWCPSCKIGLANEEVVNGKCERCGTKAGKKELTQWMLKITKYADRLLEGLNDVDYLPKIKKQQADWIGRKEWIDITYDVDGTKESIAVSTTRPDTNFGATFVVLAPEHPLLNKKRDLIPKKYSSQVDEYIAKAKKKTIQERIDEKRRKTGIFTGLYCINQLTKKKMPIFVTDFVLMDVGTGAVVGVPGHDIRDFEFAKQYDLEIIRVVVGKDGDKSEITKKEQVQEDEGIMINSDFLDGLDIHKATKKIMDYLEKKGWGKRVIRYHLRDWIFSRQHYWGEPIPIIHCDKCGEVPVPEDQLPIELPEVEKYEPTDTGESPLANITDWVDTKCPKCGGKAKRETDTMPNWAGSSWYYLAYLMLRSKNSKVKSKKYEWDKKRIKYWMPVDVYNGGMEHTTLHLLYSRFWYKFLYDIKAVPTDEPYKKRTSHGVVLGEGGIKMSKSKGNVINPDDVIKKYAKLFKKKIIEEKIWKHHGESYSLARLNGFALEFGADVLRMYEMFMGPFDKRVAWSTKGTDGVFRFLYRFFKFTLIYITKGKDNKVNKPYQRLEQTIKKVSNDIESFDFNTAVSALMELFNAGDQSVPDPWRPKIESDQITLSNKPTFINVLTNFLILLSVFAPHTAEELWEKLSGKKSIFTEKWPEYDEKLIKEEKVTIVVQINGKVRAQIEATPGISEKEAVELAQSEKNAKKYLKDKKIKKTIYIQDKLINFVV